MNPDAEGLLMQITAGMREIYISKVAAQAVRELDDKGVALGSHESCLFANAAQICEAPLEPLMDVLAHMAEAHNHRQAASTALSITTLLMDCYNLVIRATCARHGVDNPYTKPDSPIQPIVLEHNFRYAENLVRRTYAE